MNFMDGSLWPENQQKLVITAAPYGPEWIPADFPEDIPVSMEEHIQKAVDCYNAGATVLHIHVREPDGKGSKRLSRFNELLAGIRARLPDMILQVGGSISFAPEGDGEVAKWLTTIGDELHNRLAAVGLIGGRGCSLLGEFIDGYFAAFVVLALSSVRPIYFFDFFLDFCSYY